MSHGSQEPITWAQGDPTLLDSKRIYTYWRTNSHIDTHMCTSLKNTRNLQKRTLKAFITKLPKLASKSLCSLGRPCLKLWSYCLYLLRSWDFKGIWVTIPHSLYAHNLMLPLPGIPFLYSVPFRNGTRSQETTMLRVKNVTEDSLAFAETHQGVEPSFNLRL